MPISLFSHDQMATIFLCFCCHVTWILHSDWLVYCVLEGLSIGVLKGGVLILFYTHIHMQDRLDKFQARIQGGPLGPWFWGPKIEHFWALFNFSIIFFALLCSAYYFFNMLLFQSSNSKIFQPRIARHMISHLKVFVFSLSFTHFRLLGVHLSLSCF